MTVAPLAPGTLVDGFRIEAELGAGDTGVVYEATQVSLGRRVALKLLSAQLSADPALADRLRCWPEHPHVVALYAAGVCQHGRFVATALVRGSSLAALLARGSLDPAHAVELLGQVAEALDSLHAAKLAHGAVNAHNVLVDRSGRPMLTDFGLSTQEPTPAADRAAFARVLRACLPDAPVSPGACYPTASAAVRAAAAMLGPPAAGPVARRPRRRRRTILIAAGVVLCTAALSAALLRADHPSTPSRVSGAQPLGSAVSFGQVRSLDCEGRPPSGSSPACTILQAGRGFVARRDGVIRRWTVRGARGELALQVIRRVGRSYVQASRSQYQSVPNTRAHSFPADVPVRRGEPVTFAVVSLPHRIVVDLLRGSQRVVRLEVPDTDPRGQLTHLKPGTGRAPGPHLEWQNPGGRAVAHDYRVTPGSIVPLD